MKHAAWMFVMLLSLACFGWYFARKPTLKKPLVKNLSQEVDVVITSLILRSFDENGKLSNYLQADEMRHIPYNNTHLIKSPKFSIMQKMQPPWEISANYATSINGGHQITFKNNVVLHQQKDQNTQESTIKTESITYFPKNKFARTELAISFEQPGSILNGIGMKANLANKHIQLLSKASLTYDPKHV